MYTSITTNQNREEADRVLEEDIEPLVDNNTVSNINTTGAHSSWKAAPDASEGGDSGWATIPDPLQSSPLEQPDLAGEVHDLKTSPEKERALPGLTNREKKQHKSQQANRRFLDSVEL